MSFLWHIIQKEEFKCLVLQDLVEGKRARRRQSETYIDRIKRTIRVKACDMFQLARSKKPDLVGALRVSLGILSVASLNRVADKNIDSRNVI